MPHRRKNKSEFSPQLQFNQQDSYLYLSYSVEDEDSSIVVSLDTFVIIFAIKFCEIKNIRIRFLKVPKESIKTLVKISRDLDLITELVSRDDVPSEVLACNLPVWYLPEQRTCIAGLCSVMRYSLRMGHSCEELPLCKDLLGFQQGCLSAPQEVSTWTKFCEVDIQNPLAELEGQTLEVLPRDISRFESHLKQPVRMHNIREKMQSSGKFKPIITENNSEVIIENGVSVDPIDIYAKTQHIYAEGPEMLLSDILIFPIIHLINMKYQIIDKYPNIREWYHNIQQSSPSSSAISTVLAETLSCTDLSHLSPSEVPQESLYKSDPTRKSNSKTSFTRQADIEELLSWWSESGISSSQQTTLSSVSPLDWTSLPRTVHPEAGSLPPARLQRKCSQLSSLAGPLTQIARPGHLIVDFCSGGGHLGLLLAHLLPSSTVHMVENKEESLARARARGIQCSLTNVWFYQCNLEFYRGSFNIGCSLHACGAATDLVIAKCLQHRAAFVSCPCCYGGVSTSLGVVSYPRSNMFLRSGLPQASYEVLAHCADQTHAGDLKSEQGYLCMDIVDSDRLEAVREQGYSVTLSKLDPPSCTPKNNLIVGQPNPV